MTRWVVTERILNNAKWPFMLGVKKEPHFPSKGRQKGSQDHTLLSTRQTSLPKTLGPMEVVGSCRASTLGEDLVCNSCLRPLVAHLWLCGQHPPWGSEAHSWLCCEEFLQPQRSYLQGPFQYSRILQIAQTIKWTSLFKLHCPYQAMKTNKIEEPQGDRGTLFDAHSQLLSLHCFTQHMW